MIKKLLLMLVVIGMFCNVDLVSGTFTDFQEVRILHISDVNQNKFRVVVEAKNGLPHFIEYDSSVREFLVVDDKLLVRGIPIAHTRSLWRTFITGIFMLIGLIAAYTFWFKYIRCACKSQSFVRNIYGDEINFLNARSIWQCDACGQYHRKGSLYPEKHLSFSV